MDRDAVGGPRAEWAARCAAFVEATNELLEWEWDQRFSTVLAMFESFESERVRAALEELFEKTWSMDNIAQAPTRVQSLARTFGGVRERQLFDTTDPTAQTMLFCAWWPWGRGERVSIRLGYVIRDLDLDDRFKLWFGV
jgi:hypothetical protein